MTGTQNVTITLGGHIFRNLRLYDRAITHRSFSKSDNYERLEFFGDTVLNMIVSEWLLVYRQGSMDAKLSEERASYVCRQHLARCARKLNLGEILILGRSEDCSGGRDKDSILEGAMEALIAAVFLEDGLQAARRFVVNSVINVRWK